MIALYQAHMRELMSHGSFVSADKITDDSGYNLYPAGAVFQCRESSTAGAEEIIFRCNAMAIKMELPVREKFNLSPGAQEAIRQANTVLSSAELSILNAHAQRNLFGTRAAFPQRVDYEVISAKSSLDIGHTIEIAIGERGYIQLGVADDSFLSLPAILRHKLNIAPEPDTNQDPYNTAGILTPVAEDSGAESDCSCA